MCAAAPAVRGRAGRGDGADAGVPAADAARRRDAAQVRDYKFINYILHIINLKFKIYMRTPAYQRLIRHDAVTLLK